MIEMINPMYKLDTEKAKKILIEEMGYSTRKVDQLLANYPLLADQLAPAVDQWINDRTVADFAVDGLSIAEVIKKQQVHFLVAIRDLNQLLDESIPPEKRKKLRDTLSKQVYFE